MDVVAQLVFFCRTTVIVSQIFNVEQTRQIYNTTGAKNYSELQRHFLSLNTELNTI